MAVDRHALHGLHCPYAERAAQLRDRPAQRAKPLHLRKCIFVDVSRNLVRVNGNVADCPRAHGHGAEQHPRDGAVNFAMIAEEHQRVAVIGVNVLRTLDRVVEERAHHRHQKADAQRLNVPLDDDLLQLLLQRLVFLAGFTDVQKAQHFLHVSVRQREAQHAQQGDERRNQRRNDHHRLETCSNFLRRVRQPLPSKEAQHRQRHKRKHLPQQRSHFARHAPHQPIAGNFLPGGEFRDRAHRAFHLAQADLAHRAADGAERQTEVGDADIRRVVPQHPRKNPQPVEPEEHAHQQQRNRFILVFLLALFQQQRRQFLAQ